MNTIMAMAELENIRTDHSIVVMSVGNREPIRFRVLTADLYSAFHGDISKQDKIARLFKIALKNSKIRYISWQAINLHTLTEDRHELPKGGIRLTHST